MNQLVNKYLMWKDSAEYRNTFAFIISYLLLDADNLQTYAAG